MNENLVNSAEMDENFKKIESNNGISNAEVELLEDSSDKMTTKGLKLKIKTKEKLDMLQKTLGDAETTMTMQIGRAHV